MFDRTDQQRSTQVQPRYTLATALLIVRQLETSQTRRAVFEEIKAKNRVIRWVDRAYAIDGTFLIRRLLLCLYMIKCVGSLGGNPGPKTHVIAMANFANEMHTIARFSALIPEFEVLQVSPSLRNIFKPEQIRAQIRIVLLVPRLWRFLGTLSRAHSFMPACRIASALAYYVRFGQMLEAAPTKAATMVASNYSPEAVGLAAAAHNKVRRVIYMNHAPVPRNSPYVPPVLADVAVFYGRAIQETYHRRSRCLAKPIYIGQPGEAVEMDHGASLGTVGIFLTALTRKDTIALLVAQIRAAHPLAHVLIRHHPVALLETDLSDLTAQAGNISVTMGTLLADDMAACDAIVCGNSGVILNVLRSGKPAAYMAELDALPVDYNGFLESRLVPRITCWEADTFPLLQDFYTRPEWLDVMTSYDASYGADPDHIAQIARAELISFLNPQS